MATRNAGAKAASRPSVRHPSHNHPLRLSKAKDEDEIICSGCELELIGPAFKCTKSDCDYFLHKSCFQLPLQAHHKSHPQHPLSLVYSAPYGHSGYTCDACGECGTGFAYHCSECQYDLHIGCASMAETVEREDHAHPLTLLYGLPANYYGVFTCGVCLETVPENLWAYYCRECDYGTHIHSCAAGEEDEEKEEEEEEEGKGEKRGEEGSTASAISSMLDAQREMSMMHFRIQMAMQQAQMIRDMGRSLTNLTG